MKYATIAGFIVCLGFSFLSAEPIAAQTINETKIDLSVREMSVSEVLEMIEKRTRFRFVYNHKELDARRKVSLQAKNISVSEALRKLFGSRPVDIRQMGESVVLIPKPHDKKKQAFGSIQGVVTDSESGITLPGTSVSLDGTTQGTVSDVDGKFILRNVQPGTHALQVSFIGYQTQKVEGIKVVSNNSSTINVALQPASSNLTEVVVVGAIDVRYTPIENSTEETLISDIRNLPNIVTGISNLQITRSLDRDASDVVKRVPGVTVLNNFVLVRGMDPRYNVTYLNNMLVPSTESDSRAFSFNLIPSGLIDDIKIYKAPAPELPGGFGGGVLKINTKKSQAARHIQVDVSAQYRTGGSSFADYYTGSNDSKQDWLGMGLNDRKLPGQFTDENYQLPRLDFYPADRMAAIRTLPPVNRLEKDKHSLDRRLSINYYDSWKLGKTRLNSLTAISYTYQRANEVRTRADRAIRIDNWVYHNDGTPDYFLPENQSVDSLSTENVRLSVLENLGLRINEHHSVAFNLFANRSAEDNTLLTLESHAGGSAGVRYPLTGETGQDFRVLGFEYRVRDLLSAQLSGDHKLGSKHTLGWYAGRISQTDITPDWHAFTFKRTGARPGYYDWLLTINQSDTNIRQYYHNKENIDIGGLDYSAEILPTITLKAGTLLQLAHRGFENFNYNVVVPPAAGPGFTEVYTKLYQPWFNTTGFYSDENFKDNGTGFNLEKTFSATSYSFDQNITAVYIAARLKLLQGKLEFYGGMRYENEYVQLYNEKGIAIKSDKKTVDSQVITIDLPSDYEYYLPSANLTWNIHEKHKLRTSYGRTLDRPAYRERSKADYYSVRDNVNYSGNIFLQNATLDNYDIRWEWYPSESEFIAVGGYYKYIDNPIEMRENGASGEPRLRRTWENKKSAELYGTEIEVRKNLGFIPFSFMNQFSVIINASYMHTVVSETINLESSAVDARPTRPLAGSSPYAANVNLYYEHPKIKTQLTVAYNFIGERIIVTSVGFIGNLHEKSQHQLDLVAIQPIGKHLKIKGGVQNVLNQTIVRWRDGNYDGHYTPGVFKPASELIDPSFGEQTDHEGERWKPGAYYSLGLSLSI